MSQPETSLGSPSVTSSQASESGSTPCDLPVSPIAPGSGRGARPASRSLKSDSSKASPTIAISGLSGDASSRSTALTSSLVNSLKERLALAGSTLYRMTWKEKVTPSLRSVSRLAASVPRTCGTGSGSWVTPTARDWKDTPGMATTRPDGRSRLDQLPRQAALVISGPTPNGVTAETESNVRLNPELALWLMSIPPLFHSCMLRVMQSLLSSQGSSSRRASRPSKGAFE